MKKTEQMPPKDAVSQTLLVRFPLFNLSPSQRPTCRKWKFNRDRNKELTSIRAGWSYGDHPVRPLHITFGRAETQQGVTQDGRAGQRPRVQVCDQRQHASPCATLPLKTGEAASLGRGTRVLCSQIFLLGRDTRAQRSWQRLCSQAWRPPEQAR